MLDITQHYSKDFSITAMLLVNINKYNNHVYLYFVSPVAA